MNINEPLDRDKRMESLSLVIDEMEKYQIQRDQLTAKMTSWKYRNFTVAKQKKEDGKTLMGIIERIDVLELAERDYANQYIPADPFEEYLVKRESRKVWLQ